MANFVPIKGFENKYAINENGDIINVKTKVIKKSFVKVSATSLTKRVTAESFS